MSNLRICKAMSLHPSANIAENHDGAGTYTAMGTTIGAATGSSSRICLMGCEASASELRRFPIHDINRCNYWLRHFGVSEQLVKELGGLKKLRICFRHFSERKAMAKTRIKTTPLRRGNITATKHNTAATTTTTAAAEAATTTPTRRINSAVTATTTTIGKPMADSTTIELIDSCSGDSQKLSNQKKSVTTITPVPVTVAVPLPLPIPQRSHSICSSSSVSSINSDYEASLPLSALVDAHGQNGMAKTTSNGLGLAKKRKLYVITEKSDEKNGNGAANGQKRKMFVVVEQEKDTAAKKLMIVTDKSKANLTQHLEKFLPEILSCIQDKEQAQAKAKGHPTIKSEPTTTTTTNPTPNPASISIVHKPHITLPPKKNPTNFVKLETGATGFTLPSSVSILPVKELPPSDKETETGIETETETETNINLSPDFRFLMKILPKLEQLPEPHKQNVKRSIQIFVEESYSHYGKKI